jgi:hypothetical protein
MKLTLNNKQKQFLFDEYYLTSKVLDSLVYKGWEQYFIKNFHWRLDTNLNRWNMRELVLISKETGEEYYNISLNFQGNDLNTLLKIL